MNVKLELKPEEKVHRALSRVNLDHACAADENLRRKVEALLRAHGRVGDFLETPPVENGADNEIDNKRLNIGNDNGSTSGK